MITTAGWDLEVESHLSENNRAKNKTMFLVMFYLFDHRVQTSTQLHYKADRAIQGYKVQKITVT